MPQVGITIVLLSSHPSTPPNTQAPFAAGGFGAQPAAAWQQQPPQQQGGFGAPPPAAAAGGADPCATAVLQFVSNPNVGDQGVHVNEICGALAAQRFTRDQVVGALQFLQNEAHVYTTCDDNHWKATT
jgi:hypothetical protein